MQHVIKSNTTVSNVASAHTCIISQMHLFDNNNKVSCWSSLMEHLAFCLLAVSLCPNTRPLVLLYAAHKTHHVSTSWIVRSDELFITNTCFVLETNSVTVHETTHTYTPILCRCHQCHNEVTLAVNNKAMCFTNTVYSSATIRHVFLTDTWYKLHIDVSRPSTGQINNNTPRVPHWNNALCSITPFSI